MREGLKRWLPIAAAAAIVALSGLLTPRLELDEDVTAMLPASDPMVRDYRLIVTRFRAIDLLYIDVAALSDGPDAQAQALAAADALHAGLEASGLFKTIHYRMSPEGMMRAVERLRASRSRLLAEGGLAEVESRLSPEAMRERLGAAKRALIEPSGPFVRRQVQRDPLGIDELALDGLKSLAHEGGAHVVDGRIWSNDERHILLIATPHSRAMDTRRGAEVMAAYERARAAAMAAAPADAVRVSCAGGHRSALENATTMKSDVQRTVTATSLGILVLGVLFFRRRLFILLIFVPAGFGVACAMGFFAAFNPLISGVAIGCGAVLIGIAVDYGVHILYRLDQPEGAALSPTGCVRAMLLPLSMGAATTTVGLLCLLFAWLPGQRETGLFAAAGIVGAALFAVLVLPQLLPRRLCAVQRRVVPLAAGCRRFLAWRLAHRRAFGLALLIAVAIGVAGLPRLWFEGRVEAIGYMSAANRDDTDCIRAAWGEFSSTTVAARGATLQDALEANDRVYAVLAALEAEGQVASVQSIAPLVPAAATQAANAARWRAFWSLERTATVRAEMGRAAGELGFSGQAFAPFFADLAADAPTLALADFAGTPLERLIRSRIAEAEGDVLVLTAFHLPDDASLPAVAQRVRQAAPGAVVLHGRAFAEHTTHVARAELHKLIWIAGMAMAICLFLFLGRVELVATALLPVCLSLVFTLGVLGHLGIPINMISSLFVVFVFGVGLDYSIFLLSTTLRRYRRPDAADAGHEPSTTGSVVICALTTMCGFGALAFAAHPALFSIGITGTLGMASSLVFGVLVVPALADRLLPEDSRHGTPSLKTLAGAAWAYTYLCAMGLFYILVLRPIARLRHTTDAAAREGVARRYLHTMAVGLIRFFPYRHSDQLYVDPEGNSHGLASMLRRLRDVGDPPAVIVSNHQSGFDIMLMLTLPVEMAMLVKTWVWKAPIMGRMVRDAGYMLMQAGEPEAFLQRGAELLEQGVSVMIFPESTRSPDGRMRRFHKGAFELAVRTGTDVVPVLLTNTQACIPRKGVRVGDHRTVCRVLPRVTPQSFDYAQGARELGRHVKDAMRAHLHADWRLSQHGPSFWHNIRSLYNYRGAYAERYVAWKLRLDPIVRGIDDLVPAEGLVLDLGCGCGLMANILARRSREREVVGIDFDERKIAVAQGTVGVSPNLRFELADLFAWPLPKARAVALVDVAHYWEFEQQRRLIAAAAGCLEEGGSLVFRDVCRPDPPGWAHRLTAWGERFSTAVGHNRRGRGLFFATREFYVQAFQEAGLTLAHEAGELAPGSNQALVFTRPADGREP